jgi:Protein of unknown function (DUF3305)
MERSTKRLAVIMQRRMLHSRWQSEAWEPVGVLTEYDGEAGARVIVEEGDTTQWLYPDMPVELRRDEADGYYMNMSTQQPSVFVLWRMEEERAVPQFVTVSYAEAGRWMDAGERVDLVPMPRDMWEWVGGYVERNYKPEPKKKMRPQSFRKPKDRIA